MKTQILSLPHVTIGTRFGGEAFFYRKKFFGHFHPAENCFFLETFVWNNVDEVCKKISGAIPHPEYSGYGWVRLPISSEEDVAKGKKLIDVTYKYLRTVRRISIRQSKFSPSSMDVVRRKLPKVSLKQRAAKKTVQILMEASSTNYDEAEEMLDKATMMLKR